MDFDDDDQNQDDNAMLQQTIARLEQWYEQVLPPAQQLCMRVYDNHQAMLNDPQMLPNNLISFFMYGVCAL